MKLEIEVRISKEAVFLFELKKINKIWVMERKRSIFSEAFKRLF